MPQSSIAASGFAEIMVSPKEARILVEKLKNRIRRISHIEGGPDMFVEISRLARICFVLGSADAETWVIIKRMSREDVDAISVLDHGSETEGILSALNEVRQKVRRT